MFNFIANVLDMKYNGSLHSHKWVYCFNMDSPSKQFRMCPRCKIVQEYKQIPVYGFVWMNLIKRTKKGAKEWILNNHIKEE